jgi:hypothetical protein
VSEKVIDLDEWVARRDEKAELAAREAQERADRARFEALADPTRGMLNVVSALVAFTSSLVMRERGGQTYSQLLAEKGGKKGPELDAADRDLLMWAERLDDAIAAARGAADLAVNLPAEADRANVLQHIQATRSAAVAA